MARADRVLQLCAACRLSYKSFGMTTVGPRGECACGGARALGVGCEDAVVGRGTLAGVGIGLGHAAPDGDSFGLECCDEPPSDVAGEIEAVGSTEGCGFTILSTSPNRFAFAVFKNAAFRA